MKLLAVSGWFRARCRAPLASLRPQEELTTPSDDGLGLGALRLGVFGLTANR